MTRHVITALALVVLLTTTCATAHTIKHIVVLMEENRSFDHLLGWASSILGTDGLKPTDSNPISTFDPTGPQLFVNKDAPYIAPCDPDHATYATQFKIFGAKNVLEHNYTGEPMIGFAEWENLRGNQKTNYCEVMSMFPPEKLPVLVNLAQEYAIFDKFFASMPGPTWPNRQFAMAATSGGNTETYFWQNGEFGNLYTSKTIFDQLTEEGMTWANYYVDTPWELMMQTIAHNPENVQQIDRFYDAARTGNLPAYSFINPRGGVNLTAGVGANDMHPDHDVREGEKFIMEVYEAVRNGPAWNDTLFILTFDEHGGFYDHVSPPRDIPEPDDLPSTPDFYLKFNRLGLRITTIAMSPWIPKGVVVSNPPAAQMPQNNSAYDLTSIMATARKVLGMTSGPLTKRDAWAATFEHLLSLKEPRTDMPTRLPRPEPADRSYLHVEAERDLNGLQEYISTALESLTGDDGDHDLAPRSKMTKQKHFGDWAADRFAHHKRRTAEWKESQSTYRVTMIPFISLGWIIGDGNWNVNRQNSSSFVTVSTRHLNTSSGLPYCLTHDDFTQAVTVSGCYPSPKPSRNTDQRQHWIMHKYGLKSAVNPDLCLTTRINWGDSNLYVLPCNGSVQQSFEFEFNAPGMNDPGCFWFGNGVDAIAAVPTDFVVPNEFKRKKSPQ